MIHFFLGGAIVLLMAQTALVSSVLYRAFSVKLIFDVLALYVIGQGGANDSGALRIFALLLICIGLVFSYLVSYFSAGSKEGQSC